MIRRECGYGIEQPRGLGSFQLGCNDESGRSVDGREWSCGQAEFWKLLRSKYVKTDGSAGCSAGLERIECWS